MAHDGFLPDEEALERQVMRERLQLMLRQMDVSVGGMWAAGIPIVIALFTIGGRRDATILWIFAAVAAGMFRLALRAWVRSREHGRPSLHYVRVLAASSWLTAVVWLAMPLQFFRFEEPLLLCMIMVCVFGASSGALGTLGAYLPAYVGFIGIVTGGFMVKFALLGGFMGWSLAGLCVVFVIATSSIARNMNRIWERALRTGIINEALAKHLDEERARALAAQQIAEAAVQAKSRFLAAASHDLRQPLHAQGLFLGALARITPDAESAQLVARIGDTSRALQELLDALLDISKLDAGVVIPSVRPFPLQQILDQVRGEFAEAASAKGIALRIVPCSAWVNSDPVLVGRVARNLVSNAIRYTERGRVLVGCKRGKRIQLCVLDSGVGIPAKAHEEIFEEFVQLHNPERDRSKGIGLGLAIVRRLSSLLGADLVLRSTVDRGSVFALALDQVTAPPTILVPKANGSVSESHLKGLRVLVVDDEMLVLEALQGYLESLGCIVHAASNGDEVIEVVETGAELDVVMVDYRLRGEETGLGVLERLRKATGRTIPSVMITGDTAPERIREVVASGHLLLHKPVATNQLIATLTALGRRTN